MENDRYYTRVNYSAKASVRFGVSSFTCNTANLSLRGMYLKTDHEIPLNSPLNVTVYNSSRTSLNFNAMAVRKEKNGLGLQINDMDADTFDHLRQIIVEISHEHERIARETYSVARYIH